MSNLAYNQLDQTLSPSDIDRISAHIKEIKVILPVKSLSEKERPRYKSMNVGNKIFVEKVVSELKTTGKGIMPPYIVAESIENDLELFKQLDAIEGQLNGIMQQINDLKRIASEEALSMANVAYKIYDSASKSGIPNAKSAYDNLKTRYTQGKVGRPAILDKKTKK